MGTLGTNSVSCVPAEAPLCQKAIRPLHYQCERHEVLQGEASIKGMTEPDVRAPGCFGLCTAPPQSREQEISYKERVRRGGQAGWKQYSYTNLAMNLVFCELEKFT